MNKVSFAKKLSEEITVYSCTFFKEITGDDTLQFPDDCQHSLLY